MAKAICVTCGHIGKPKTHTKGSFIHEVALWLLGVIPGLIYSLSRLTTRCSVCRRCGHPYIIPVNTPGVNLASCSPMLIEDL